jgi:hypothetical protein
MSDYGDLAQWADPSVISTLTAQTVGMTLEATRAWTNAGSSSTSASRRQPTAVSPVWPSSTPAG